MPIYGCMTYVEEELLQYMEVRCVLCSKGDVGGGCVWAPWVSSGNWWKYDVALVGTKLCKYEHVPDGQ